jgi:hypothetical protein
MPARAKTVIVSQRLQKNDDRDAEGIAEAATRATMRFVELKSQAQLDPISLAAVMMVSAKYSAGAPLVSISVSIRDRGIQKPVTPLEGWS